MPLFESSNGLESVGDRPSPGLQPPSEVGAVKRSRGRAKRQVLPSHLLREVIRIEPGRAVTGLKKIGEQVTETLDYRPARLVVIGRVRAKADRSSAYGDPQEPDGGVLSGALPSRPIDKGIAEASLLAHSVIEK
jgi:transposase